jgi:hypothetical protein
MWTASQLAAELSCELRGVDDVGEQNGGENSSGDVASSRRVSVTSFDGTIRRGSLMRPVRCSTDFSAWCQEELSQLTTCSRMPPKNICS